MFKKFFPKLHLPSEPLPLIPVHIAIIMDGNGRWANKRGLPRTAGHQAGLERMRDAVEVCLRNGIKYLTLYAFSTENWHRPVEEVNFLMNLFEKNLDPEVAKLHQHNVKIKFIGLKNNLSPELIRRMEESERLTGNNQALTLNIALNYGGRAELVAATQNMFHELQQKKLNIETIDEAKISNYLFTTGQPDPDLLIRPGGERRISNFLIWQLAYAELYFSDLYWPDFDKTQLMKALHFYSQRERRFGRVKEVKIDG